MWTTRSNSSVRFARPSTNFSKHKGFRIFQAVSVTREHHQPPSVRPPAAAAAEYDNDDGVAMMM